AGPSPGRGGCRAGGRGCTPGGPPSPPPPPGRPGAPAPDAHGAPLIERARRAVPSPSPWPASFDATADTLTLRVATTSLAPERIAEVWFYPARWGAIDLAAPQEARVDARGITITVARGPLPEATAAPIDGVLVLAERLDGGAAAQAFALRAAPRAAAGAGIPLLQALALALAGGIVLNLMPCVLPVLSVKAMAL